MAATSENASSPELQLIPDSKLNADLAESRRIIKLCSNECCPYSQSLVVKCERCQQESMSEISSSSELQSVTPLDLPNSVITLLQGAGLLQNLTQIAEQTRSEDEHVLTDKLEMVKETNNQLETSDKEINEKNTRIASLEAELTELKQQVEAKEDERERLLLKRKLLNEECNTLQKKLHCCDSLLKVVPRGDSDV